MNLTNATVQQILIPVSDFERGVAFYRDTLGIPFLFSAPPQMAFFMCGSVRLLVGVPPEGRRPSSAAAVYFGVPDIQAAFASLEALGVAFQARPHVVHRTADAELWLADFSDPDGNQLALMSERATPAACRPRPARTPGEEGTMSDEPAAPETQGVTVKVLTTVDLGPEIEGMAGRQLRMRMVTMEPGAVFGPVHDHKGRPGTVYILQGTITDHRDGLATDYGPGVGWPEDRNTTHWLENRGTIPAVEISVDIVRQQ